MRRDATTELLKRARRRITDPARWTHGVQARDAQGCCVDPREAEAVAWCAVGAIRREACEQGPAYPARWRLQGRAYPAGWRLRGRAYERLHAVSGRSIEDVNDAQGHAAVLALFDAAIREK